MCYFYFLSFFSLYCTAIFSSDHQYTMIQYTDTVTQTKKKAAFFIPHQQAVLHKEQLDKLGYPLIVTLHPLQKVYAGEITGSTVPNKISYIALILSIQAEQDKLSLPYPRDSLVHKGYIQKRFSFCLSGGDDRIKKLWNFIAAIDSTEDSEEIKQICNKNIDDPHYNFFDTDSIDASNWTHDQFRNQRIEAIVNYLKQDKNMSFENAWCCMPQRKHIPFPLPQQRSQRIACENGKKLSIVLDGRISSENWNLIEKKLQEIKEIIENDCSS